MGSALLSLRCMRMRKGRLTTSHRPDSMRRLSGSISIRGTRKVGNEGAAVMAIRSGMILGNIINLMMAGIDASTIMIVAGATTMIVEATMSAQEATENATMEENVTMGEDVIGTDLNVTANTEIKGKREAMTDKKEDPEKWGVGNMSKNRKANMNTDIIKQYHSYPFHLLYFTTIVVHWNINRYALSTISSSWACPPPKTNSYSRYT